MNCSELLKPLQDITKENKLTLEYLISVGFLRFKIMGGESNIRLLEVTESGIDIIFQLRMIEDDFFIFSGFISKQVKTIEELNKWLDILEIDLNKFGRDEMKVFK